MVGYTAKAQVVSTYHEQVLDALGSFYCALGFYIFLVGSS